MNTFRKGIVTISSTRNIHPSGMDRVIEHENQKTEAPIEKKLEASNERIEFLEDCIAEMAGIIYS